MSSWPQESGLWTRVGALRARVGIEAVGMGGFWDRKGEHFLQGGWVGHRGMLSGPRHSVYSTESQDEKGTPYDLHPSFLGEGGSLMPVSPLVFANHPFEQGVRGRGRCFQQATGSGGNSHSLFPFLVTFDKGYYFYTYHSDMLFSFNTFI